MRYRSHATAPTIKQRSLTVVSLIVLTALLLAVIAVMFYYFFFNHDLLFTNQAAVKPGHTTKHLKIANTTFLIPENLIVSVKRSPLRKIRRITISIPRGWALQKNMETTQIDKTISNMVIANLITSPAPKISKTERLGKIYRLYMAGPAAGHVVGLYRYTFTPDSPYSNTELFVDNLQHPEVFIHCNLRVSNIGSRLCRRNKTINKEIQLRYQFSRHQLTHWHQIHKMMENFIAVTIQRAAK